jgi:[acyl-carrier-protein] S-malonyltransferase
MTAAFSFLFPGQGAQTLGMAVDLVEAYPEARRIFELGQEILGRDFIALCRNGPEEELSSTRTSQPAILLHSLATLAVLSNGDPGRSPPSLPVLATAGLSLGEYAALVFAGAIELEDAVRIVGLRGEYMQEACDAEKGSMASIVGLAASSVEEVVARARADGLAIGIANYNSPDQTVISGAAAAVDETVKRLEQAGARRAIRLKVAGAYHSPLMAAGTRKLEPHLRALKIRPPRVPFYANVTGAETRDPEEIRTNLIRQIESSVRWEQIIRALLVRGMRKALEVGPGRVLAGLMKSISRDVEVASVGNCESVAKWKDSATVGIAGPAPQKS